MDPTRFSARRIGPLDVSMLERQIECLTTVRDYVPRDELENRDAVDGMANLARNLIENYEYQVQEEGFARRHRMYLHTSRAADELRALAELSEEDPKDDDRADILDLLDRFDEVHSSLQSWVEDHLRREREAHVTVTLRIRREWIEEYRDAISEDGSNDDEHDLLVEIGDDITRFMGHPPRGDDDEDPLGDPPPSLADAWDRYQQGGAGAVKPWELSKLDEWRDERAREAGF